MTVAIDFDGTWTADPLAWREVAEVLKSHGHTCIMVTNRLAIQTLEIDEAQVDMPVVYANGDPKRSAAESRGFKVDVWIDDMPVLVDGGETGLWILTKEQREAVDAATG